MNHRNGFNPLSRTTAHRRAMSRNMVTSLFRYERITTTKAKALEIKRTAEKLITRSKIDSVHNRRQIARYIQDEIILVKLFTVIGPRMKDRAGGYTRVIKLGFRQGDDANMVILELVDYKLDLEKKTEKKEAKAAKKTGGAKKDAEVTADNASDEGKKTPAKKAESKKPAAPKKTAAKSEVKPAVDKKPAVRKTTVRKSAAKGT